MILSAGLSPAWQHILAFDALRLGEVNRTREVRWCASGKVINAARAVHRLAVHAARGPQGRALTLLGGPTGDQMRAALAAEGLAVDIVQAEAPTRVCTSVLGRADGAVTELVENAAPLTSAELEEFRARFRAMATGADIVLLLGSLPAGASADYYRTLIEGLAVPALLDARGSELLETLVLRPFLVKPNREELARTLGRVIRDDDELREAMRELARRGARWVLVSQGRGVAWVLGEGTFYRVQPPRVEAVNPIGSGDCLAGGIAWAVASGAEPLEAIRWGIAAAAENATSLLPGDIDAAAVARRRAEVRIEAV
jgi:tagatose 6-phosphate kinase